MCRICGCGETQGPFRDDRPTGVKLRLDGPFVPIAATVVATAMETVTAEAEHNARLQALEHAVLDKNHRLAQRNRDWFTSQKLLALNILSAPGSGKTTLLERTIRERAAGGRGIHVIEGDQATQLDADRIRAAGAPVVQINTGAGCHLDADMVERAAKQLDAPPGSVLLIENVGNLVCPALFDLGERARVVIASVTEGDDKPLKYPHMFRDCDVVLLNKIDLLPHVPFDPARFATHVRQMNPSGHLFSVSALHGAGMSDWYDWLDRLERAA
jgi:hydrogenase nickel incorporation protein HypB